MQNINKILIAECSKVHGLQGAFQLKELNPESQSLKKDLVLTLKNAKKEFEVKIEFVRGMEKKRIIKFYNFNDRNGTEGLLPFQLLLEQKDLKPLPPGEYYPSELEGCEVKLKNGELIGIVKMIYTNGAQPNILIEKKNGEELDLPLLKSFVLEVDKIQKIIIIELPDYIEENE